MALLPLQTEGGEDLRTESRETIILEGSTFDTIEGNAGFRWTPAGTSSEVELPLAFPLTLDPVHANQKTRASLNSLDYAARDVVVSRSSVDEYEADARFVTRPQRLLEMMRDSRQVQVDYYEDLSDNTTKHEAWLLGGASREIENESEERGRYEWQARLRLRAKTGDFDDLM